MGRGDLESFYSGASLHCSLERSCRHSKGMFVFSSNTGTRVLSSFGETNCPESMRESMM